MPDVDRRGFMKTAGVAALGGALLAAADEADAATYYAGVDESLFKVINRQKDPKVMSPTEMHHVPALKVIGKAKAGEPFVVEVRVGRELHDMSIAHRILDVTLLAGNEPVGTVTFSPVLAMPAASFMLSLDKPVTLVAQARCNLHGLWEGTLDVNPA